MQNAFGKVEARTFVSINTKLVRLMILKMNAYRELTRGFFLSELYQTTSAWSSGPRLVRSSWWVSVVSVDVLLLVL